MQCNLIRSNVVPPRFPELQNPLTEAIKKNPLRQFQGKCVNKRTKSPMETEAKKIEMNRARGVGALGRGRRASGLKFICKQSARRTQTVCPKVYAMDFPSCAQIIRILTF